MPAPADNPAMQAEPRNAASPKRKRRWFQFSLRSLLIFTLICAIACGWLGSKIERKRREREAVKLIQRATGEVWYDYQYVKGDFDALPPEPAWLRGLLGDDWFHDIKKVSFAIEFQEVTRPIPWPKHERAFTGRSWVIGDLGRFSESEMTHLEDLRQLEDLDLRYLKIADASLKHVAGLTQLRRLVLEGTQVTDAGLDCLKGLQHLETLRLENTKVTSAGVRHLREALPHCRITYLPPSS
jgi:hypothetical protein